MRSSAYLDHATSHECYKRIARKMFRHNLLILRLILSNVVLVMKRSTVQSCLAAPFPLQNQCAEKQPLPVPPRCDREQETNVPVKLGENAGTLFGKRSEPPPQMRRAASAKGSPNRNPVLSTEDTNETLLHRQAIRLRRLHAISFDRACVISRLAYQAVAS